MFRGSGSKFKRKSNLNILTEKLLEATEQDKATLKRGEARGKTEVKLEAKVVEKDKPLKFINFKSLLTS